MQIRQVDADPFPRPVADVYTNDDARRLVAAWNLLDGFSTSDIETSPLGEIFSDLLVAKAQRDELLQAIKSIIELNVQYAVDRYGDPLKAESMECVRVARAAIAKVEGK